MTEPTLRSSHLFTLTLQVDPNMTDIGETPYGRRRIATVTGGSFEGEELRGSVLPSPGGDWLLLRRDGILQLDVRLTLKTDDGHLVYMSYRFGERRECDQHNCDEENENNASLHYEIRRGDADAEELKASDTS